MTIHDDTDDLVSERQRIRNTDHTCRLGGQVMDIDNLQPGLLETLSDLWTTRIDRNSIFSDNHIDASARSDQSRDLRDDARDASPKQRAHDN